MGSSKAPTAQQLFATTVLHSILQHSALEELLRKIMTNCNYVAVYNLELTKCTSAFFTM